LVIVKPVVTEKTHKVAEHDRAYTFMVDKTANKIEIKNAVEKLFKVNVLGVRTMNVTGKAVRFRFAFGKRQGWKKAVVTIKEGQKLDIM
jgi:large subunit ribosomal protein L23